MRRFLWVATQIGQPSRKGRRALAHSHPCIIIGQPLGLRARRVFGDLPETDESCGLHRVEPLMCKHQIRAIRGYKSSRVIAGRPSIIAPNHLQRAFTIEAPNTVWMIATPELENFNRRYSFAIQLAYGNAIPFLEGNCARHAGADLWSRADRGPRRIASHFASFLARAPWVKKSDVAQSSKLQSLSRPSASQAHPLPIRPISTKDSGVNYWRPPIRRR